MTDEYELRDQNSKKQTERLPNPDASVDMIYETMETFLMAADVDTVYKEPIIHGDTIIIPAAEVVAAMGFGVGQVEGGDEDGSGGGLGGGGGGRVFSRPVAVIVASPEGVRVEPVFDLTKIALAGITAGAFMLGMLARLRDPKKAFEDLNDGSWG